MAHSVLRAPTYHLAGYVTGLSSLGILAVALAVSAVEMVAREPVQFAAAVIPTVAVTVPSQTTTPVAAPPPVQTPAPAPAPNPVPVPQAPAGRPDGPIGSSPPPVQPSPVNPPPRPPQTRAVRPSSPAPTNSFAPTPHRPFPGEQTDFPGPPGTNG